MKLEQWLKAADERVRSFERAEGLTESTGCETIPWMGEVRATRWRIGEGCYRAVNLKRWEAD